MCIGLSAFWSIWYWAAKVAWIWPLAAISPIPFGGAAQFWANAADAASIVIKVVIAINVLI